MIQSAIAPLRLVEYEPLRLKRSALTDDEGEEIWRRWGHIVEVDEPSLKNDRHWVLTNLGHAGFVVLRSGRALHLAPRVQKPRPL